MKEPNGFTFTSNGVTRTLFTGDCVVTKSGKIAKKYEKTLLAIKNGKKFYGYVKETTKDDSVVDYVPYPRDFEKIIKLLSALGITTTLIDEEPQKKTKGKYIIIDLSPEQEAEINRLKSFCK